VLFAGPPTHTPDHPPATSCAISVNDNDKLELRELSLRHCQSNEAGILWSHHEQTAKEQKRTEQITKTNCAVFYKNRDTILMAISLSNLNQFAIFPLADSLVNLQQKVIKNPTAPCICCHTSLCNINARKQVINDKLQGHYLVI